MCIFLQIEPTYPVKMRLHYFYSAAFVNLKLDFFDLKATYLLLYTFFQAALEINWRLQSHELIELVFGSFSYGS